MKRFVVKASSSVDSADTQYRDALIQTIKDNYDYGHEAAYPYMFGWLSSAFDRVAGKGATIAELEKICEYEGYPLPEKPY